MLKSRWWIRLLIICTITLLVGAASVVAFTLNISRPSSAAAPGGGWSNVINGLRGRLSFTKIEGLDGTPFIVTYLELQNVSDIGNVLDVPLKIDAITFKLRDETGKIVPSSNGIYDGLSVELGMLRLPHDSTLRFNIASQGAGVMKHQAALMDLGPSFNWTFPAHDPHVYSLSAMFTIQKSKGRVWAGTIEIPATALPSLKQ